MTNFIQEPQHRIYLRVVSGELPISAEFREFSVSGLGCADRRSCGPFRRFITTVIRFIGPCAIRFRSCRPVRQATGSSFPSEGEASCQSRSRSSAAVGGRFTHARSSRMSSGIFEKSSISSFAWAIQRGFSNVAEQRAGLLPINAAVYPIACYPLP
jgi:hypothetical protein